LGSNTAVHVSAFGGSSGVRPFPHAAPALTPAGTYTWNGTDWVLGGGTTRNVTNLTELQTELAAAQPGDTVRVTSSITIPDNNTVTVNAGVILAIGNDSDSLINIEGTLLVHGGLVAEGGHFSIRIGAKGGPTNYGYPGYLYSPLNLGSFYADRSITSFDGLLSSTPLSMPPMTAQINN
jgi:hypothetical protein